jgi:cyclopropane fatty-acyl-phospholipid synthase-like methyltransferase
VSLKKLYGWEYVRSFQAHQSPKRLKRIIKYIALKSDYVVGDFACGSGMMMPYIAPKVKYYIGVDFSEPFIQAARSKKAALGIDNAEFIYSEIADFCNQSPERFDMALAMDLSEHVDDREWPAILKSIRLSLKNGGRLYMHTPNAYFFIEALKACNFIFKQFPEHIAVRTPQHNFNLLKEAGFSEIKLITLAHYNILKYIHPLSYLPVVGKYFKARIFIIARK